MAGGGARSSPGGEKTSILGSLRALLAEVPGFFSDRINLMALELRQARMAMEQILVLLVAALIFAGTAWVVLWIGLVVAAVTEGLPWGWVLLAAIAVNLVGAYIALQRVRMLSRLITLPATLRRMTIAPAATSAASEASEPPLRPSSTSGDTNEHATSR